MDERIEKMHRGKRDKARREKKQRLKELETATLPRLNGEYVKLLTDAQKDRTFDPKKYNRLDQLQNSILQACGAMRKLRRELQNDAN